jgi:hypothetical protein
MQRLNIFMPIGSREESDDAATNGRHAAELGYFVLKNLKLHKHRNKLSIRN